MHGALSDPRFPRPRAAHLFAHRQEAPARFPTQAVRIDWDCLVAKRPTVLATLDAMPGYLLKPEVLSLLAAEKHPTYRLLLDL